MEMRGLSPALAATAALFLAAGCASFGPLDTSRLDDPSLRVPVGELSLAPVMDFAGVRLDLRRHVVGSGSSRSQADYAPIGIGFGRGIVMDANLNLGVDLLSYFGLDEESFAYDYYVSFGKIGNLKKIARIERSGGEITRSDDRGLITVRMKTKIEGDRFTTEGPAFSQVAERGGGGKSLTLEQRLNLFTFRGSVTLSAPDRADVSFLGQKRPSSFVQESPANIVWGKFFSVERLPDRIRIAATLYADTGVLDLIPSTEGFFVFSEKGGFVEEVRKEGRDIRIYLNGTLAGEYRRVP